METFSDGLLRIWHLNFDALGSFNDKTILDHSKLFSAVRSGRWPPVCPVTSVSCHATGQLNHSHEAQSTAPIHHGNPKRLYRFSIVTRSSGVGEQSHSSSKAPTTAETKRFIHYKFVGSPNLTYSTTVLAETTRDSFRRAAVIF